MTISIWQLSLLIFATALLVFGGFLMLQFSWRSKYHITKERCDLIDFSVNLIQASIHQAHTCLTQTGPSVMSEIQLLNKDVEKLDQLAARLTLINDQRAVEAIQKMALLLRRVSRHCQQRDSVKQDPLQAKFLSYVEQRKLHSLAILSTQYQHALSNL